MFVGNNQVKIDEKNRLRMPSKHKKELGTSYYITVGDSRCLYIFTPEGFEEFASNLHNQAKFADKDIKMFERAYFAFSEQVEEDTQGRFVIPQKLKAFAQIEDEVMIVGVNDRLEIWSLERWEQNNFDIDKLMMSLDKYNL